MPDAFDEKRIEAREGRTSRRHCPLEYDDDKAIVAGGMTS